MATVESYTNLTAPDGLEEVVVSDVTNANVTRNIAVGTIIENRKLSKSVAGGVDVALTVAESLYHQIELTGTITADINVTVPDGREMMYQVYNNTSGDYTVTLKTVSGTGSVIPQGFRESVSSDGTNVVRVDHGDVPVGSIIPFMPGYFTDGSNGGYTFKLGAANTVAAANTWLAANKPRFVVTDGSNIGFVNGSPIFDNTGAYLPNITDDRFLMGDTVAGGGASTGSNTMAHTHGVTTNNHTHAKGTLSIDNHTHQTTVLRTGWGFTNASAQGTLGSSDNTYTNVRTVTNNQTFTSGNPSTNGISGSTATGGGETVTSGAASNTENRPLFLSCLYIMRKV